MPRLHLLRLPSRLLRRRARKNRMATLVLLLTLVGVVLFPFYAVYKPPTSLITYFSHRWPDVLFRVDVPATVSPVSPAAPPRKLVALTIDDAPSEYTRGILDVLARHGARATFFVIGAQVPGRQSVLRDAVADGGHELGNHGMHDEAARALADGELAAQMAEVDAMLREVYASVPSGQHAGTATQPPRFFRPGSGFFSDHMRALVHKLGYRMVLGSVYPHDAQISYPWLNTRHILSMLRPGAIVVCHDRRPWTEPMLAKMLPAAILQGYEFVTVSELLAAGRAWHTVRT